MRGLDDLLTLAVRAALEAGDAILQTYDHPPSVTLKEDLSPLTQADQASHRIIHKALESAGEKFPVLSEEGPAIPYSERKLWKRFWLVDPLDGTKEFISRNGEFTVNIALVEEGKPILGVVYAPVTKTVYFGGKGIGAYKNEKLGVRSGELGVGDLPSTSEKLSIGPFPKEGESLKVITSRSHLSDETKDYVEKLERQYRVELVSAGSSLKFGLLAEGKIDLYPRFGPTMEWDTAAGQAVVEAAGGAVLNHETDLPLVYNKENLLNPWFIASAPKN